MFLSVSLSTKSHSQDLVKDDKIFLGLSAGRTSTTFVGSHIDNHLDPYYSPDAYIESRKGIVISMNAKITLLKYFFLRPSFCYIQKGATEMNSRFLYPFQADLDYLSFPLLVGFQPINFDNVRRVNLYIEGGVVPNFEVSRKNDTLNKGYASEPEIKTTILSYQFGAGIEIKVLDKIILTGNYSYFKDMGPFFEVFKTPQQAYNKGTSISIGIMIGLNLLQEKARS
jgi:hypothetical protein